MNKQNYDDQIPNVNKKIFKAQKINNITEIKALIQKQKNLDEKIKYVHLYAFDAQEVNKIQFSNYQQSEYILSQIKKEMKDKIYLQVSSLMKFRDFQLLQFLNDKINLLNQPISQFNKLASEKSSQLLLVVYSNFIKIHNILQFYENYIDQLINLYFNIKLIDQRIVILTIQDSLNKLSKQTIELLQPYKDKEPKSQVDIVNQRRQEIQNEVHQKKQLQDAILKEVLQLKEQEFTIGESIKKCLISYESQDFLNLRTQQNQLVNQIQEKSNKLALLKQQTQLLQTQLNQTTPEALFLQNQKSKLKPKIIEYQKKYEEILQQKEDAEEKYLQGLKYKESYNQYIEQYKKEIDNILQQQTLTINFEGNNLVFKEFSAQQIHLSYFNNDSMPHLQQLIQIHSKIVEIFVQSNQLQKVQQNIISLDNNNLSDIEEIYEEKNKLDIQIIQIYLKQKQRILKEAPKN